MKQVNGSNTFTVYCLDERIAAPAGWAWKSVEALTETLRSAVMECER